MRVHFPRARPRNSTIFSQVYGKRMQPGPAPLKPDAHTWGTRCHKRGKRNGICGGLSSNKKSVRKAGMSLRGNIIKGQKPCCTFACFHPFYSKTEQKRKKPITRAVISFFPIYRSLKMSRSSRNRTHIDGFGDHCSTFELCSYLLSVYRTANCIIA